MTLAMGFKCVDGVILCADTQLTLPYPYSTKYPSNKIFDFRELQSAPFFTYAGDVAFSTMCIHRIANRFSETEKKRAAERVLVEEVRKIHAEYHSIDKELYLQLIVAFRRADAKVALYRVMGAAVEPCVSSVPVCVGVGTPVAMAVMAPFYPVPMTMSEACRTAVYALFQVKNQVEGVGGLTEIVFLRDGRDRQFYHIPLSRESVRVFEETFTVFQEAIRPVLLTYTTLESDTPEFKDYLKQFERRMLQMRSKHMQEQRRADRTLKDLLSPKWGADYES